LTTRTGLRSGNAAEGYEAGWICMLHTLDAKKTVSTLLPRSQRRDMSWKKSMASVRLIGRGKAAVS
jgi:hypothetical protein